MAIYRFQISANQLSELDRTTLEAEHILEIQHLQQALKDKGVKVNYGKFGDLLAEVKSVTGKVV